MEVANVIFKIFRASLIVATVIPLIVIVVSSYDFEDFMDNLVG